MSSQIIPRAVDIQGPFTGLREFSVPSPCPSVPPATSSPTAISKKGPLGLLVPPPQMDGIWLDPGREREGEQALWPCSLSGGKYSQESREEPFLSPSHRAFLFSFPHHVGHLPEYPEVTTWCTLALCSVGSHQG